jgi:colanic acid/amylovoran biosynthesis glycosyltransferase
MRVSLFTGSFPKTSESWILSEVETLILRNHDVEVYAFSGEDWAAFEWSPAAQARLNGGGAQQLVTYLDQLGASVPVRLAHRVWAAGGLARRQPSALGRLLRERTRGKGGWTLFLPALARTLPDRNTRDVLHCHFGLYGEIAATLRASGLALPPIVATFHGYDANQCEGKSYRRVFDHARLITTNTRYTAERVRRLGADADRMRIVPMGTDTARFVPNKEVRHEGDELRIGTVCRLIEAKGTHYLVQAFAALREHFPRARLCILGEGPRRPYLEQLAAECGVAEQVHFLGRTLTSDVVSFLQGLDIFVLPSCEVEGWTEGQGVVVQEAQACGVPVVATRHGGVPEGMRDGETGILVDEHSVEALLQGLRILAADSELRMRMGAAGRRFVEEHYSLERTMDALERVFEEAAQSPDGVSC